MIDSNNTLSALGGEIFIFVIFIMTFKTFYLTGLLEPNVFTWSQPQKGYSWCFSFFGGDLGILLFFIV